MDDARLTMTPEIADARRRVHRVGHRRVHHHRARAQGAARGRPAQDLAVLHSRRRSSTSRPARCRSASAPRGRTRRPAPPARRRRTPSATRSRSSGAATPTSMIAGGSEAAITPMGVGGFAAMRALSTRNDEPQRASRPFDKDRDGFVIGEGAGVVHPRGARVRAGAAARRSTPSSSATACRPTRIHITAPSEDGDGARARRWQTALAERRHRARRRSTTSTRTAPRRRYNDSSRRWRSSGCSASTRASWRCRRPSR